MGNGPDRQEPSAAGSFSNLQWYMYHQQNVAFFAAFSRRTLKRGDLPDIARDLVALAPQLKTDFADPDGNIPPELVSRLLTFEQVEEFDGFPDRWIDAGSDINARPDLPMFRVRVAVRRTGPDSLDRASFVLVQVSHALVEGADSALLSRSRSASRQTTMSLPISTHRALKKSQTSLAASSARLAGKLLGGPAAVGHLLACNFMQFRKGPFVYASHVADRRQIATLARTFGVRQRALLFALGLIGLFGAADLAGRKRLTSTYSVIDSSAEAAAGGFMRMRMLFASFKSSGDLAQLAANIDAALLEGEAAESGFNQALNMSALAAHRRLHRLIPSAYKQQVFNFMPYDAVLGLIPPHRLEGALTNDLIEPVYAGAALEGSNACVLVPGKTRISFNFYAQQSQIAHVGALAALLESLSPAESKPSLQAELDA